MGWETGKELEWVLRFVIKQHTKNSIVFSADKRTIIRRKREKFLTSHCQFFIVSYLKRPILPYSLSFSVENKNENRKKKILSIFCCRRREQVLNFIHSFFSFCRQTILLILIWIAGQVTKKLRKLSTIWRKPSRWEKRMLWCGADIGLVKEQNMPCSFCVFPSSKNEESVPLSIIIIAIIIISVNRERIQKKLGRK